MARKRITVGSLVAGIRDDWLAQQSEDILEPDLPIIDPHHHLWDVPHHRYLLPQLLTDLNSGHDIRATVYVNCQSFYRTEGPVELRSVGEIEFANGVAAMATSGRYGAVRVCAGIVGFASLGLGAKVEDVLAAQVAAGNGRYRGVRHASNWDENEDVPNGHTDPPAGLLRDSTFRQGFAKLRQFNLSFDAWLYHPQLADLTDLARAFPEQPIVLNHVGGVLGCGPYAGRRDEIFAQWRREIYELSTCPNVFVKLGGLGMKISGFGFENQPQPPSSHDLAVAWRPYIETCIEAFTPQRCMFEGNFPVDKISCAYPVLWNAYKRLTAGAMDAEKTALFYGSAERFYRLADETQTSRLGHKPPYSRHQR